MTEKPIKTRVSALENNQPQGDDHEYTKVISWGDNDDITERFYRDGIEITRGEYKRVTAGGKPSQVTVDWGNDDQAD